MRRRAILRAAHELALEVGPISLSLNELGRRSGVSKPNIYRYFESREHVLLQLFVVELESLIARLEESLAKKKVASNIRTIAREVSRGFVEEPLACQLMGMVSSILEHNVGADAIASAKRDIFSLCARLGIAFTRALPALSEADAMWAAYALGLYVAGMWPSAFPSPAANEVLARPEFAPWKLEAGRELERFVGVLLRGSIAES